MRALPRELKKSKNKELTGVACVECPGVVQVEREGQKGYLKFTCRVGHVFSAHELLTGKEHRLEERLWAAILSIEEMIALLREMSEYEDDSDILAGFARRVRTLEAESASLRALLHNNDPIDLTKRGPPASRDD